MKKIVSLFLSLVLLCAFMPAINVFAAVNVSKNSPTEFFATAYESAKDASRGTNNITVEGGNLSYGAGDWSVYELNCTQAGVYSLYLLTAINGTGPKFQVYVNEEYFSDVKIADGKEWVTYVENEVGKINLKKGKNQLKISSLGSGGCYFRAIILRPVTQEPVVRESGAYKEMILPTIIESEDFDCGSTGAKSIDGINQGKKYRQNEKVDIYDNNMGGFYIDLSETESTTYTFEVPKDGAYTLYTCKNTIGNANIYFDDFDPILLETNKESAETERFSVYLTEGVHKMTVEATGGSFLVDYIRFVHGGDNPIYLTKAEVTDEEETEEEMKATAVYKTIWVDDKGSDANSGEETAPFKTVERALEEVEKINDNMTGDIIVNIMSGEYFIPETINITNAHSGKNGYDVYIRGYNEYEPPVLHGGKKVTGWENTGNGIYKASLDVEDVRNLYIDGQPAIRARSKYIYYIDDMHYETVGMVDGLLVKKSNFPSFSRPEDLETVWNFMWTTTFIPVEEINEEEDRYFLKLLNPMFRFKDGSNSTNPIFGRSFYLENAIELLDEPGEFYYNKEEKQIYYYPYNEQDLQSASVYAPVTEFLVDVKGESINNKVENITFENIDFRYGAWNHTSENGFRVSQAGAQYIFEDGKLLGQRLMPAQFTVNHAENVNIKDSRFSCMTATTINMVDGVENSVIDGCAFWNLGGAAVSLGTFEHNDLKPDMEQCDNITVSNNLIRRVALEYTGSVPITTYYNNNILITHNDIKDVPYSGITAGWGWGASDVKVKWKNNDITYNRVEDVVQMHSDGGHIYTLGDMPESDISYNYLVDNPSHSGGIYNDSGSANIVMHHNVIEDVGCWWLQGTYYTENLMAYNNYSERLQIGNLDFCDSTTNMKQEELIPNGHTVVPDGNWPKEAIEIIDNSGLSSGYEYLFDIISFPEWMVNPQDRLPEIDYISSGHNWFQAEDFLLGGEGIGYHKINPAYGHAYRPQEGVDLTLDLSAASLGYAIQTVLTDEWWAYGIEIEEDGEYAIDARIGQQNWGAQADIYLDGELISENIVLEDAKHWNYFLTSRLATAYMTKGKHTLKIVVDNGFFLDALSIVPSDFPMNRPDYDEAFDEGKIVSQKDYIEAKTLEKEKTNDIVFADTKDHWIKKDVSLLTRYGIVEGVGNNSFAPDEKLTKEQAVLLVLRALNLVYNDEKEADFVNVALENGIITDTKGMKEAISREEYAAILANVVIKKFGGYDVSLSSVDNVFADSAEVNPDYKVAVAGMNKKGLIIGDENGCFNPKATLTRAEAARTIKRLVYLTN